MYQATSQAESDSLSSKNQALTKQPLSNVSKISEMEKPILENQKLKSQLSKAPFQKSVEEIKILSSSPESSSISIRAEAGAGILFYFIPLLLEFQTPVLMNNKKLKWLIQAGAGGIVTVDPDFQFYVPVNTGFRYDLQPFTVALKGGTSFTTVQGNMKEFGKTASLSIGWNITNSDHIELSGGLFFFLKNYEMFFTSLSVSFPIKKW